MAFSTNTSIDFSTSVGYTLSNATISGGTLTITGTFTGTATCETPDIDTSTWDAINRVAIDDTESVGWDARYLVSFDSGSTWYRYRQGLWVPVATSNVATDGMTTDQLQDVRDWSPMASALTFYIGLTRASSSPTGNVSGFTVYYLGSGAALEPQNPAQEPAATGDLEDDLGIQPEFGSPIGFTWPVNKFQSEGNYEITVAESTVPRRKYEVRFRVAGTTDRDAVVAFLEDHYEASFTWATAPLTGGTSVFQTASEPTVTQEDAGAYSISCVLWERKA